MNSQKAADMSRPRACVSAHPADCFEHLTMKLGQVAMENRFMVRDPISEATDNVKALVHRLTTSPPAHRKASEESLSPDVIVITWTEEPNPKGVFKF
ncbi:hypothetical protein NKH33_30590 [Mesorhizobium sp. M1182]|uniref:hypothetical protein n=1 Tax=Mesorhizobium sp. M1182 TaxID=2957067 RepID=UPI00333AE641